MTLQVAQALAPLTGTIVTQTAVAATDTLAVDLGKQYVLMVVNGNASPDVVAITASGRDAFGRTMAAMSVSVTNATTQFIWLPLQQQLANSGTGLITITHSVTATVTCAVIAVPNALY